LSIAATASELERVGGISGPYLEEWEKKSGEGGSIVSVESVDESSLRYTI
jgi:hypothetical protein